MKYSRIIISALIIATTFSCQKQYDMVPPPAPLDDDDLDDEDFGPARSQDIFVTPFGEGEMDGSSWENACDVTTLLELMTDGTDLSKKSIHVSEGTYYLSQGSEFGPIIRKDIKSISGGYSQMSSGTDLSQRNPEKFPTYFSGDLNKNGKADEGDCGLMVINGGKSSFSGITFTCGYVTDKTASAKKSSSGFFVDAPADSHIELKDCVIEKCKSGAAANGYAGGAAIYAVSGQVRLKSCILRDCSSASRGGAIRGNNANAVFLLDRCAIYGNSVDTDWGSGLQLSHGTLCMNNTTIFENTAGHPQLAGPLNGAGAMLLLNSTIISNDKTAAVRCESYAGSNTTVANSIVVTEESEVPGFLLNGKNKEANSGGFNIFSSVKNFIVHPTDKIHPSFSDLGSFEDNVFIPHPSVTMNVYAKEQDIKQLASAFNPAQCPTPSIGEVFAAWCDGFGIDQKGNVRNKNKMMPGAWDAGLPESPSPSILNLKMSVLSVSGDAGLPMPKALGLIIDNPDNPAFSYSKEMVLLNDSWTCSDGTMLMLDGRNTTISTIAYSPFKEGTEMDSKYNFVCSADQRDEDSYTSADFLFTRKTINPAADMTDGMLALNMKHLNASLTFIFRSGGKPVPVSEIEGLRIDGLANSGVCDFSADTPAMESNGASVTMFPLATKDSFKLITVPQSVDAKELSLSFSYRRGRYNWSNATGVSFAEGKNTTISINID